MIYEVIYNPIISNNFEDHVKNVFKIDYQNDCFVYFHFGPKSVQYLDKNYPDTVTSHMYIKELETRFNVNINWINLDFIFENLANHPILPIRKDDVERIVYYYKQLYFNSIEDYIKQADCK
jgi:type I site-specific restriction-modification system R (restriction) subunit